MSVIRALTMDDVDACMEVAGDRGWVTARDQWTLYVKYGRIYGIEERGLLCGTVTTFAHECVTFIGMMLVRQQFERRGLGRRLLQFALDEERVEAAALYATEFGKPLYLKIGFTERGAAAMYGGTWNERSERSVSVRTRDAIEERDIADLIAADAAAFGCARPNLIRGFLERASGVAMMNRGESLAYAIAREVDGEIIIGPVVAPDEAGAVALISALGCGKQCRINVPGGREMFEEHLVHAGMARLREIPLMTKGPVRLPNGSLFGIGSMATG